MSRTVSKSISAATVFVFDPSIEFTLDENGFPLPNRSFELNGNPSNNRARIQAQKLFGKNVLITNVQVDESKLSVPPAVFVAHSDVCKTGETYGREYITQTFKITHISGFYTDDNGMHMLENCEYFGTTTANKLRNFVCDMYQTQNVVITSSEIKDERRYMTRELYLKLATEGETENENK